VFDDAILDAVVAGVPDFRLSIMAARTALRRAAVYAGAKI